MGTKRELRLRILDIVPWVDYEGGFSGVSYAPQVRRSVRESRVTLEEDISIVEAMGSVEVHLLGDSPYGRVVIKAAEG